MRDLCARAVREQDEQSPSRDLFLADIRATANASSQAPGRPASPALATSH